MSPEPPHHSPSASDRDTAHAKARYSAIRRVAVAEAHVGEFANYLVRYKLESTLARISQSPYAGHFVLKGGVLLSAYAERRATRDLDALMRGLEMTEETLRGVCEAVAAVEADDGLVYDLQSFRTQPIRDGMPYTGLRVMLGCVLHTDRQAVTIDISTGDPVDPEPRMVTLHGVLGDEIRVLGYPRAMIIAEKSTTAIALGETNTRWKDYDDLRSLARYESAHLHEPLVVGELRRSIATVAAARSVEIVPLREALPDGFPDQSTRKWTAWRRKQRRGAATPESLGTALDEVSRFVDPVLDGSAPDHAVWDPERWVWHT